MKNKSLFLIAFLSLFLSSNLDSSWFKSAAPVEVAAVQHADNFAPYTYSGSYYDTITATGEGLHGSLRTALSSYITPVAYPTYSGTTHSNCLAFLLQEADENPTDSTKMLYLYTRDSVTKNAASSWNREHVWPQSLSNNNWGTSKGGVDLLHIRPTYPSTNSSRGNCIYAELDNNVATYKVYNGMHYGYMLSGKFEPLEATKGDVARIIMYIWVAYQNVYSNMPLITQVFESYDTLLNWHTDDQPDVLEGNRNDFAQNSLQKNRNPFVDHPEYAWKIFGNNASPAVKARCMETYPDAASSVTLDSIQVTTLPNKTTYYIDETLDTTGIVVTGNYSDGTTKNVTSSCSFSPTTFSSLGTKAITVSGLGKTTTFNVNVVDYETVPLTGISIPDATINIEKEKTHTIVPTCAPSNVYPYPAITFNSNNTLVATVNSTTGVVTAVNQGTANITVTATQGSITKTTIAKIIVTEAGVVEIVDIYDQAAGTSVKFYGLYLGSYSNQYSGIFIGNGDYAIMVYGYTGSVSSFVPYETYVLVAGTVKIYENLHEVVNDNTVTPLSIATVNSEIGVALVNPVTTYQFVGNEPAPGSGEDDPTIQSRPTMVMGTVYSVSGTISATTDATVVLDLDNGNQATIFIKKNSGLDYAKLQSALGTTGKYARVKGYLGVYKTKYQIVLPTVIDPNPAYTAASFATDFLTDTGTICSNNGSVNNRSALLNIWISLEQDKYIVLALEERNVLKNANTTAGTTVANAMARYDYVVAKYALTDFIGRNPAPLGVASYLYLQATDYVYLGVFSLSLGILTLVSIIVINRKKKIVS
ncbi:MAG: endonuclease [Bacilli bacterium]